MMLKIHVGFVCWVTLDVKILALIAMNARKLCTNALLNYVS